MPCLCSINLNSKNISDIDKIIESIKLKYDNKINKIVFPQSYLMKFDKLSSSLYSFIFIIGVLVFIVSIFNVSNVIKLNLDARNDMIDTLILHGADRFMIRATFIIEGLVQGFLGSLFSCLIIFIIFSFNILNDYNHFLISAFISSISFKIYILLNVIFGILLGFIGSNLGTSNKINY